MKTMKYHIMTIFPQPIHSIISHFISVIAFTPYSPKKQKFNKFVKEAEVSEVQGAYDHPPLYQFSFFPLSSKKKTA